MTWASFVLNKNWVSPKNKDFIREVISLNGLLVDVCEENDLSRNPCLCRP